MTITARCKETVFFVVLAFFILSLAAVIALAVLYSNELAANSGKEDDVTTTKKPTTALPTTTRQTEAPTTTAPEPYPQLKRRINCFPEQQGTDSVDWTVDREHCEQRGCRFDTQTNGNKFVPICYMHPDDIGFAMTSRDDSQPEWFVNLVLEPLSNAVVFEEPIGKVSFRAKVWNNQYLQIKIDDINQKRYEVPLQPSHLVKDPSANAATADFELTYTEKPFSFQVKRKSTKTVLFDTSMGGFVFSNRFLQLSVLLPSKNFYGLGEHEHPNLRHNMESGYKTWPMFAKDQYGLGDNYALYGTHPFYMVLEDDGNAHGVFLLNSNAMEMSTIPAPGVIMRTIGGIFDLHISTGPAPEQVVQQHTDLVGKPFIPPYWALGFQLSRFGYKNLTNLKGAVDRTRSAGIPLDVIFADIDHMDRRKDFTIDTENFAGLGQYFADERKNSGLRSIIILDPAVPNPPGGNYEPWKALNDKSAYVKWADGRTLMGHVWPDDDAAFPDFFLQSAQDTWVELIANHSKTISFDGLWIDMNEPANFGTNEWGLKCDVSDYDDPPYRTWAAIYRDTADRKARLSDLTLCMEARQNNGQYRHYDVHNLYGLLESPATLKGTQVANPGRRSFILSRSTFAGIGQYAAHWLGDNRASWEHLQHSVVGMLEMSMFGLAHTGADICGFIGATTPELCLRWMELGAFYPYSRNHNDDTSPDQDPAIMGSDVAMTSAYYMKLRYERLPYLYTLFYYANKHGSTVARPMFFEFPTDQKTWNLDRQFMLGPSLLVAPIMEPGRFFISAYVPKGTWLSLAHNIQFMGRCSGGSLQQFFVNGTVLLQRGGSIVPTQDAVVPGNRQPITTAATRKNSFGLTTVLGCDRTARGTLFWDDGESINTVAEGKYLLAEYTSEFVGRQHLSLTSKLVRRPPIDASVGETLHFRSLLFYGAELRDVSTISVTCTDVSACPTPICKSYSENMLTCDFGPPSLGIPIINDFTLNITLTRFTP